MDAAKAPSMRLALSEALAFPKVLIAPLRGTGDVNAFGRGQPVMVIPGLLAGDITTILLRRTLDRAGFASYGWGGGVNSGVSEAALTGFTQRLQKIHSETGQKVILIGWSLGGVYARVVAQRRPDMVSAVITLGTPFSGDRRANNAWILYELINGHSVDAPPVSDDPAVKPPVPTIAVWSPNDGVVAPASASGQPGERDEAIEIPYRHLEMGTSRRAIQAVLTIMAKLI